MSLWGIRFPVMGIITLLVLASQSITTAFVPPYQTTFRTSLAFKETLVGINNQNHRIGSPPRPLIVNDHKTKQKTQTSFALFAAKADGNKPDVGDIAKYAVATAIQCGILGAFLKSLDQWVLPALPSLFPKRLLVGFLFVFLSLRSRVASVLDNSRPNRAALDGKATPSDVKRPSWTPPGIAFPFIWLTITALRGISTSLVYGTTGSLVSTPILAMILHLSIGDTWNTITNVEKRLGVSAVGVVFVWASVWNAILQYYSCLPLAGKLLSPSGIWISIATVFTITIWRINEPVQPLWPVQGIGKSADFKWSNLGQLQATSIGGSEPVRPKRINSKIDLDSPKVATMETLSPNDKKVYCRCWKSGTFPLCDGAHMAHNKATGDNVGPVIISAKKP